jgi:hypothetical protein
LVVPYRTFWDKFGTVEFSLKASDISASILSSDDYLCGYVFFFLINASFLFIRHVFDSLYRMWTALYSVPISSASQQGAVAGSQSAAFPLFSFATLPSLSTISEGYSAPLIDPVRVVVVLPAVHIRTRLEKKNEFKKKLVGVLLNKAEKKSILEEDRVVEMRNENKVEGWKDNDELALKSVSEGF